MRAEQATFGRPRGRPSLFPKNITLSDLSESVIIYFVYIFDFTSEIHSILKIF